jgi:hypothetical protein
MATPENQTAETPARTAVFEERRRWPRFPKSDRTSMWFSTPRRGAQRGQLEDIALGGLCIHVMDLCGLDVGQQVVVGVDEWMIPAKIVNVVRRTDAHCRVGMEWLHPESPAVASLVEHCCAPK